MLAAVCLAALILPLSFTGGAMATVAIGRDLGGSALALSWITNAFMLSFGSLFWFCCPCDLSVLRVETKSARD